MFFNSNCLEKKAKEPKLVTTAAFIRTAQAIRKAIFFFQDVPRWSGFYDDKNTAHVNSTRLSRGQESSITLDTFIPYNGDGKGI